MMPTLQWIQPAALGAVATRKIKEALQAGSGLRLCVVGGRRSQTLGAIGFALYLASGCSPATATYEVLLRGGKLLTDISSAFLAEALALEWALECLSKLVGNVTT